MTTLPLFDLPMQRGAGSAGRPVDAGDAHQDHVRVPSTQSSPAAWGKSDGTNGVRRARGSEIPQPILRVLSHKAGGFSEFRKNDDGQVIGLTGRSFHILELEDGRFLREWNDGAVDAAPPAVNAIYIADGLRFGTLVEVNP